MLNDDHVELLTETAKKIYKIDIKQSQIINLILSKFECLIRLYTKYTSTLIKGKVTQFRVFPLRLDFFAPLGTTERQIFIDRISEEKLNIALECEIGSQGIELLS